jgi:hypothetical protein
VRDSIFKRKEWSQKSFPALKVPKQCSFFFLVEIYLREGKAVGSENG